MVYSYENPLRGGAEGVSLRGGSFRLGTTHSCTPPRAKGGDWSLDVFHANSNESTGLAHRNKRFVPQRMEMSTKRLFRYKPEMRAFDW
ncbi:MAG: hypothetical protein DMG05_09985 [Acidobacteria bacterium]|nr:MAG: hypothetical protein DMG05_09985 [Acidobacteriota bacterium]